MFDSYRDVSAGQSHDQVDLTARYSNQGSSKSVMVEVAGIEPDRTVGNLREPLGSRTKSRDLSGPVGSRWVGLLTPSTWADFNC